MSQHLKIASAQYNRRARRYYRRMVIGQPTERDEKPFRFMPERENNEAKHTNSSELHLSSGVWLAVLLAIAAFTFICVLSTVMLAQGLVR